MTRKHFEAIAGCLRAERARRLADSDQRGADLIEHVAHLLSARIQPFSGRFEPARFIAAVKEKEEQ